MEWVWNGVGSGKNRKPMKMYRVPGTLWWQEVLSCGWWPRDFCCPLVTLPTAVLGIVSNNQMWRPHSEPLLYCHRQLPALCCEWARSRFECVWDLLRTLYKPRSQVLPSSSLVPHPGPSPVLPHQTPVLPLHILSPSTPDLQSSYPIPPSQTTDIYMLSSF